MPTDVYYSAQDATFQQTNGTAAPGTLYDNTSNFKVLSYAITLKGGTSYQSLRGAVKYTIGLVSSATISAVTGYLYCEQVGDGSGHGVQKITSAWTEASSEPTFDATVLATIAPVNAAWVTFSSAALLALVQGWVNGSIANNGLRFIRNPDTYTSTINTPAQYRAREYGGGFVPYLSITYTLNAVPTAPTGLAAGSAVGAGGQPISWTHNDPNGDPQAKFQVRWRRAD